MKLLNFNKVLCLSPHPDDVEYGMLGSILKFIDTEFDILIFSQGGNFDDSSSSERYTECELIWNEIDNLTGHFLPRNRLGNICEDELVNEVEVFTSKLKYDCIFTPPSRDSHFEHRLISQISYPLVRRKKCGIVQYKTPSTLENWSSNFFVQINLNKKAKFLKYFESQTNKSFFNKPSLKSFHTDYQCTKRSLGFVELYNIIKIYN